MFDIITLPIGYDNYAYCITWENRALVVDASEATPILRFIEQHDLTLQMILSTHHHGDHTGGNRELKKRTGCTVLGGDKRISGIDRMINDKEIIRTGPFVFECIAVPGHTRGCCNWYFKDTGALFTGDTLFYSGCGRLFEGTADEMYRSLKKIADLPTSTTIYCGHEYTMENLHFAQSVEPDNNAIADQLTAIRYKLDSGNSSGPSSIAQELATNPFLRTGERTIRETLYLQDATEIAVFSELRRRKNHF